MDIDFQAGECYYKKRIFEKDNASVGAKGSGVRRSRISGGKFGEKTVKFEDEVMHANMQEVQICMEFGNMYFDRVRLIDTENCRQIRIDREGKSVDDGPCRYGMDAESCEHVQNCYANRKTCRFEWIHDRIFRVMTVSIVMQRENGEDGRLQGLLELAGIKYVGCDMTSSAICMDKYLAHELVATNGILTPISYLFENDSYDDIRNKIKNLHYPLFVKPLKAGSSFGITKIKSEDNLKEALEEAYKYDNKVIIEENIDGFEVGCAILGNHDLVVGEVDEIELQDGFFDYFEKYNLKTSRIILPARLSEEEREKIKKTALEIYKILGCTGFARVDMFYTKDKKIVFNEVNTIPGCTSHSRYPSMLNKIGISFPKVIDKLIKLGLER